MMTEGEPEKPVPANPAPGEENEGPIPSKEEGVLNQSEELKKQVGELTTQVNQAGFNIQRQKEAKKKLIQLLKDNNIEIPAEFDEPSGGISEERVKEIIQENTAPLLEEIKKSNTTMGELARALASKSNLSPGGGTGQKPLEPPKEPILPQQARDIIKHLGLKWMGKGRVYESPKTKRVYDLDDDSTLGLTQT